MNEQHTQPTAEQLANTQTVYYWVDKYWTLDEEEAVEADNYGIYAGKHSTLEMPDGSSQYDITQAVNDALNRAHTVAAETVCDRAHTVEAAV